MLKQANYNDQDGYFDDQTKQFHPIDKFQKANLSGKDGYWNAELGFVPLEDQAQAPGKTVKFDESGQPQSLTSQAIDYGKQAASAVTSNSLFQDIGQDLSGRADSVLDYPSPMSKLAMGDASPSNVSSVALDVAGNIIGAGADVVSSLLSRGVKAAYKTLPGDIRADINSKTNDLLKTGMGKQIIKAASSGVDAYNKVAEKYPDAVRDFENAFNIMSFGMARPVLASGAKAAKVTAHEVADIASDTAKLYAKTAATTQLIKPVKPIIDKLNSAIDSGITSIVNIERKDLPAANRAVQAVLDNADKLELFDPGGPIIKGKLPVNKFQFDDALDQIYDNTFQGSTLLKQFAADQKVRVDASPIVGALEAYKSAITTKAGTPEVLPYVEKQIARLKAAKDYSIDDWVKLTAIHRDAAKGVYDSKLIKGADEVDRIIYEMSKDMRNNAIDGIVKNAPEQYKEQMRKMADLRILRDYIQPAIDTTKGITPRGALQNISTGLAAVVHFAKGNSSYGIMNAAKVLSRNAFTDRRVDKFFAEISKIAETKKLIENSFNPKSALGQGIQDILNRGGKRGEVINELKRAGVSEPGLIANDIIKRYQLTGPARPDMLPPGSPGPLGLPGRPMPEPGVTMRNSEDVFAAYSPELASAAQTRALPPGQGFIAPGMNEAQDVLAGQVNPSSLPDAQARAMSAEEFFTALGGKKISSSETGAITKAERRNLNAKRRGLTPENR